MLPDVNERQTTDERIEALLREKEVLLKEIHHRVKNNLQVVSSLLSLQSRMITDPQARTMFQESQNRIETMALLQDQLYLSKNLSDIDYSQYVNILAERLYRTYRISTSRINLKIDIEEVRISFDDAVSCGLILSELISNCLKHAFPDGRKGEIRIELHKNGDQAATLLVADNGVGLPEESSSLSTNRPLGLRLVRIMARTLGAAVEVHSHSGTEVRLIFPRAKHREFAMPKES